MDDATKIARNKENKQKYYVNNLEKIRKRERLRYELKKQNRTEEQKQQQMEYQKLYRLKNYDIVKQKENEYNQKRKEERKALKEERKALEEERKEKKYKSNI
jgi:hypothetical protein